MFIVKVGTKQPTASFFKPATFTYGYLKSLCGKSFMVVDAEHRATPYATKEEAHAAIAKHALAHCTLIESNAVKPIPKKSGFFS